MKNKIVAPYSCCAVLLAALSAMFLSPSADAQIIYNGTNNLGTNITTYTLVPVSGSATLLVNSNSVISNTSLSGISPGLRTASAGTYYITNNGLITNSGITAGHQAVDFNGNNQNYQLDNHGVIAINPTSIYEAVRSIQGTSKTGTINNWGTIQGSNSGALINFNGGTYTVNNYSNILGSIAAYGGA